MLLTLWRLLREESRDQVIRELLEEEDRPHWEVLMNHVPLLEVLDHVPESKKMET